MTVVRPAQTAYRLRVIEPIATLCLQRLVHVCVASQPQPSRGPLCVRLLPDFHRDGSLVVCMCGPSVVDQLQHRCVNA